GEALVVELLSAVQFDRSKGFTSLLDHLVGVLERSDGNCRSAATCAAASNVLRGQDLHEISAIIDAGNGEIGESCGQGHAEIVVQEAGSRNAADVGADALGKFFRQCL